MIMNEDLVVSMDTAGRFSAEETSRLAALAAFGTSSRAKGSLNRVLGSLEGHAKVVGASVLKQSKWVVVHPPSKKAAARVATKRSPASKGVEASADRRVHKVGLVAGAHKQNKFVVIHSPSKKAASPVAAKRADAAKGDDPSADRLVRWGLKVG